MSEGFPEVPFSQELRMMLSSIDAIGGSEYIEEYRPTDEQYALSVGDYAIVTASGALMDSAMTIGQIIEAEGVAPDWEERLLKSYLPLKWHARDDLTGDIGWFSRIKLMPLTEEQFKEIYGWMESNHWPKDYPDWMVALYEKYTDTLHAQKPDTIPKRAVCQLCGSRDTEIHAKHTTYVTGRAGEVDFNGEPRYVALSELQTRCETEGHIHCNSCEGRGDLSDDEFHLDWPH